MRFQAQVREFAHSAGTLDFGHIVSERPAWTNARSVNELDDGDALD